MGKAVFLTALEYSQYVERITYIHGERLVTDPEGKSTSVELAQDAQPPPLPMDAWHSPSAECSEACGTHKAPAISLVRCLSMESLPCVCMAGVSILTPGSCSVEPICMVTLPNLCW